ncbi:MAG: hypothetical protein JST89_13105 [Cyanobacteria bacterium SZAS-4]|nr:hypothetical protein [Cyanobacteria bacterium SZAS-4]
MDLLRTMRNRQDEAEESAVRGGIVSDVMQEDGTRVITKTNNTVVIISPDGRREIRKPDIGVTQLTPDGRKIFTGEDGEVIETLPEHERPFNVVSTSTNEGARLLSNFAHTPFVLDDVRYHSVEGFYVSLKFSDAKKRREMAKLFGAEAKDAGKSHKPTETIYGGVTIKMGSPEHQALIGRAIRAKIEQNPEVAKALIESYPREIIHNTGRPDHPKSNFPATVFVKILTELRDEFRQRE